MNVATLSVFVAVGLFVGVVVLIEVGRRIGVWRLARDPEGARTGTGVVDGAIFGLLGLLIAFTFSGAAARFDARRELIVEETNAIGTAWLRIDLLPGDAQRGIRDLFRRYLDSRLAVYAAIPDMNAVKTELVRSQQLQDEVWSASLAACREVRDPATTSLVVAALNAMIDITTTRTVASMAHPPTIIYVMLVVLALACALLVGYSMAGARGRNWLHIAAFAAVVALTVYVTLDLEFPRLGMIRIDAVDQILRDLRESMD